MRKNYDNESYNDYGSPMIVKRIVYSKGGHSMRNKVNLLMKLVSLKMKREEGPAPGSTWMFFFLGWPPSKSAMVAVGHPGVASLSWCQEG